MNSDVASFISTDVANNYGSSPILSLFYRGIKLYYKDTVQQRIDTIENLFELYERRKEEEFRDYQMNLSMQVNLQEQETTHPNQKAVESASENINLISNLGSSSEGGKAKVEEEPEPEPKKEPEPEPELESDKETKKDSKSIFKEIQSEFKSLVTEVNVIKTRMYDIIKSETTKIDGSNNIVHFQDILNTVSSLSKFDDYATKAPSIKSMLEFLSTKVNTLKTEASDKREYYAGESKSKVKTLCYWSVGFVNLDV